MGGGRCLLSSLLCPPYYLLIYHFEHISQFTNKGIYTPKSGHTAIHFLLLDLFILTQKRKSRYRTIKWKGGYLSRASQFGRACKQINLTKEVIHNNGGGVCRRGRRNREGGRNSEGGRGPGVDYPEGGEKPLTLFRQNVLVLPVLATGRYDVREVENSPGSLASYCWADMPSSLSSFFPTPKPHPPRRMGWGKQTCSDICRLPHRLRYVVMW